MSRWVIRYRSGGHYLGPGYDTWFPHRKNARLFGSKAAAGSAIAELPHRDAQHVIVRLVPKRREDKWLRWLVAAVEDWERSSVRENGEKWHIVASAAVDYVKSLKEKNP